VRLVSRAMPTGAQTAADSDTGGGDVKGSLAQVCELVHARSVLPMRQDKLVQDKLVQDKLVQDKLVQDKLVQPIRRDKLTHAAYCPYQPAPTRRPPHAEPPVGCIL